MRSDLRSLARESFDYLVIGGGIQGAAIARELALRGTRTLLVDRADFAAGTSSRSSRLIHGGVRYLERLHFSLVREALRERERLLRLAPHLVRPLPMLMPFFAGAGKSPWKLKLGLRLYSWLAGSSTLPRPTVHDARDCRRLFPALRSRGLRGGALYYDAATEDCRLTLAVLAAAWRAGAWLVNHAEVIGRARDGVVLRDRVFGVDVPIAARAVVNAAGPHADAVRAVLGVDGPPLVRTSRGSHLVLPALGDVETAIAAFLADGRIQFLVPHRRGLLCGTTEVEERATDDAPSVPEEDVRYLLDALGQLLEQPPARADVRFAYCGWRALPAARGPAGGINREAFMVPERSSTGTVHTVLGGKLTTHRAFAERAVNAILGRRDPSPSRREPLPGGEGQAEPRDPLWWRHGARARDVRALAQRDESLLRPLFPDRDVLAAEVVHAVQSEGAVTFADVMLRRLFTIDGPPRGADEIDAAFAVYARHRPAGLPPLDEGAERAGFAEQVRALTGALGIVPDATARVRT